MKKNRLGKYFCKIVLTGGPCAGKSTAQNLIAARILSDFSNTWRVFVVDEAASLLYRGRIQRAAMDEGQVEQWQEDILRTIVQLEDVYENIAQNEELRHTLIICDRGAMDPKVYATPQQWTRILQKTGMSEQDILARYDYVLQLAIAPREFYAGIHNNPYRRETYEEAQKQDKKYTCVWQEHPHLLQVSNTPTAHCMAEGWHRKFEDIFEIVEGILNEAED